MKTLIQLMAMAEKSASRQEAKKILKKEKKLRKKEKK